MLPFRFIEYTVKGKNFRIFYDDDNDGKKGFHKRQNLSNHLSRCEYIQSNATTNNESIERDLNDLRKYGVIFSGARTGFNTKTVVSTINKQLDNGVNEIDEFSL